MSQALAYVDQSYFNLETTYAPTGIVRERVFFYELYHQIRCIQEQRDETSLTLNGEIDKSGHLEFKRKERKNPDFVFHIPGEMNGNTLLLKLRGK